MPANSGCVASVHGLLGASVLSAERLLAQVVSEPLQDLVFQPQALKPSQHHDNADFSMPLSGSRKRQGDL